MTRVEAAKAGYARHLAQRDADKRRTVERRQARRAKQDAFLDRLTDIMAGPGTRDERCHAALCFAGVL